MTMRRMVSGARMTAGLLLMLAALGTTAQAGAYPPSVPEIDPGSVLSAFTLLAGGLMVVTDRRRAK